MEKQITHIPRAFAHSRNLIHISPVIYFPGIHMLSYNTLYLVVHKKKRGILFLKLEREELLKI